MVKSGVVYKLVYKRQNAASLRSSNPPSFPNVGFHLLAVSRNRSSSVTGTTRRLPKRTDLISPLSSFFLNALVPMAHLLADFAIESAKWFSSLYCTGSPSLRNVGPLLDMQYTSR